MTTDEIERIKHIRFLCDELLLTHIMGNDDISSHGIDGGNQMNITVELLRKGMSFRKGFNKEQIILLGEKYPLKKGWMRRLIGKSVSRSNYEKFVSLKDTHLQ